MASFAYARVSYSNDKESQREKFILVVWIGPGCKVMRKAKVSLDERSLAFDFRYASHLITKLPARRPITCQ